MNSTLYTTSIYNYICDKTMFLFDTGFSISKKMCPSTINNQSDTNCRLNVGRSCILALLIALTFELQSRQVEVKVLIKYTEHRVQTE